MKKIIWISGGILFVCIIFFISGHLDKLWAAVLFGSLAALIYQFALSIVWFKKIKLKSTRITIAWTLIILVLVSSVSAILNLKSSTFQTALIASVHRDTETSILRANINEPLLNAFRTRYGSNKYRTVSAAFYSDCGSLISPDRELQFGRKSKKRTWHIYLAKIRADSVVLVGESSYLKGKNPHFLNYSGSTGDYQVEGILTNRGVYYERTN